MTIEQKKKMIKNLVLVSENVGKFEDYFFDDDGNFLKEKLSERDEQLRKILNEMVKFLVDDIDQTDEVKEKENET